MKAIRIGICVLLAFSVLAHGAVEPWSEAVLEIGSAVLFVWWGLLFAVGVVPVLRWNWLLGPVAGLWALAVSQYFLRLSVAPFLTEIEILKFAALGILLFLAVRACKDAWNSGGALSEFRAHCFSVLAAFRFLAYCSTLRSTASSIGSAGFGTGGVPFGPYVNRDHFSGID